MSISHTQRKFLRSAVFRFSKIQNIAGNNTTSSHYINKILKCWNYIVTELLTAELTLEENVSLSPVICTTEDQACVQTPEYSMCDSKESNSVNI
jgi:hypothetical protein